MNYQEIFTRIISCIRSMLSSPAFLEQHRIDAHFVRKRKLSMQHIIYYLLYTNKSAMHLNRTRICQDLSEIDFPSDVSKQAISKARKGILPSLFHELFRLTVRSYYQMVDSRKTWNGYHLFAVDGSKLQLPNSKDIRSVFGSRFNTSDPTQVYSLALCSTLYDVLEDIIVDASIYPDLSSERNAVYEHLNATLDLDIFHNSILIFDRGYYSAQIYCDFYNRGLLCLMRVKESLKITRSDSDDSIQFIKDPVSGLDVPVRVIRVVLDSGTVEYLVTNVFDPSITPEMFKQLYFFRWKIESKYNELKNQWGLEEFSGSASLSVMQDLFINMMYSNLSSIVKKDADIRIANSSRPDNKFAYQANRAFIIGEIKYLLPRMLCGSFRKWMVTDLFLSAAKVKSQIQPGRKYKRCKKKDNLWTHFNHRKTVL